MWLDGVDPSTGHTSSRIWKLETAKYSHSRGVRTDERAVVLEGMRASHYFSLFYPPLDHFLTFVLGIQKKLEAPLAAETAKFEEE